MLGALRCPNCLANKFFIDKISSAITCDNCGASYKPVSPNLYLFGQSPSWELNYSGGHSYYSQSRLSSLLGDEDYLSYLPLHPGSLVLDVGCGDGVYLSSKPDSIASIGLDVSPSALLKASSRDIPNSIWISTDKGIPLVSSSVDILLNIFVVEHLIHSELVYLLSECYRVMKPGSLALFVTDGPFYDKYIRPFANLILRHTFSFIDEQPSTGHINLMYPSTLEHILLMSGFKLVSVKKHYMGSRFPFVNHLYKFLRFIGLSSLVDYFAISKYALTVTK